MISIPVRFSVDPDAMAWLGELKARLSLFADLAEKPVDLVKLIRDLPRGAAAIDVDVHAACGAGEHRVILQFAQPYRELMAALRAFQGRGDLVSNSGHFGSPSLGRATMVNESPPAREVGGDAVSAPPADLPATSTEAAP